MSPTEKFREYLATKDMRLTLERELIADEIFSFRKQFDSEKLLEQMSVRKTERRVSRATVYRTLSWLVDAKLVQIVGRRNDLDVYEPIID